MLWLLPSLDVSTPAHSLFLEMLRMTMLVRIDAVNPSHFPVFRLLSFPSHRRWHCWPSYRSTTCRDSISCRHRGRWCLRDRKWQSKRGSILCLDHGRPLHINILPPAAISRLGFDIGTPSWSRRQTDPLCTRKDARRLFSSEYHGLPSRLRGDTSALGRFSWR